MNQTGEQKKVMNQTGTTLSQFFNISLQIQNEIMTPKSEFGSRVKFFFGKFSLEMIEFILIRNPNEILRVKLSKLGFHFQNFIPYKKRPYRNSQQSNSESQIFHSGRRRTSRSIVPKLEKVQGAAPKSKSTRNFQGRNQKL